MQRTCWSWTKGRYHSKTALNSLAGMPSTLAALLQLVWLIYFLISSRVGVWSRWSRQHLLMLYLSFSRVDSSAEERVGAGSGWSISF